MTSKTVKPTSMDMKCMTKSNPVNAHYELAFVGPPRNPHCFTCFMCISFARDLIAPSAGRIHGPSGLQGIPHHCLVAKHLSGGQLPAFHMHGARNYLARKVVARVLKVESADRLRGWSTDCD